MEPGWLEHLSQVADPRAARGVRHRVDEVLAIVLIAAICGAEDCENIEMFGQSKEPWLRTFLELRHGIALGLLKRETTNKHGIKNKRLTAGWNEDYLLKILAT